MFFCLFLDLQFCYIWARYCSHFCCAAPSQWTQLCSATADFPKWIRTWKFNFCTYVFHPNSDEWCSVYLAPHNLETLSCTDEKCHRNAADHSRKTVRRQHNYKNTVWFWKMSFHFSYSALWPWSSWMKNGTEQPTLKWQSSLQRECTALNWAKVLERRLLIENYCVKILGLLQSSEIFISRKNS